MDSVDVGFSVSLGAGRCWARAAGGNMRIATNRAVARFIFTVKTPAGASRLYQSPNCNFAASDIISFVQGGSQTISTLASVTPGTPAAFC